MSLTDFRSNLEYNNKEFVLLLRHLLEENYLPLTTQLATDGDDTSSDKFCCMLMFFIFALMLVY